MQGEIPQIMKKIMKMPTITQKGVKAWEELGIEMEKEFADEIADMTPERLVFHSSRAAMALLMKKKFQVIDLISNKHIDWTGAKEKGIIFVAEMVKAKKIKKKYQEKLERIIKDYIGSPSFLEKWEHYLTLALTDGNKDFDLNEIDELVQKFHTYCLAPSMDEHDDYNGEMV